MIHLSKAKERSVGYASGTFGELLQGVIGPEKEKFLVTMPIEHGSTVRYECSPDVDGICVEPAHKTKSLSMARKILNAIGKPPAGSICIESDLPEGKGMASSSADMIATARAITSYWNADSIDEDRLAAFACEIEPTDGVMYDEHVGFAHCSGRLLCRMKGELPLVIIAHDEGGEVDTVAYNSESRQRLASPEVYGRLLPMLELAFCRRDRRTLGWISTISATLNQELLPKATLGAMLDISRQHDTLGVIVAHSGTCIGILIDPTEPRYLETCANVSKSMYALGMNHWTERSKAPSALEQVQMIRRTQTRS